MSLIRREHRSADTLAYMLTQSGLPLRSNPRASQSTATVLQHSAVWACVRLVSDLVGMLPLKQYRSEADHRAEVAPALIVRSPSGVIPRSQWMRQAVTSLMLRGNVFGKVVARSGRFPSQVELFDPDIVVYDAANDRLIVNKQPVEWADVFHIAGMSMPGSRLGLSPIAYHAATIGVGLDAKAFGAGFFQDGAIPPAIISSKSSLTRDQAEAIKHAYTESRSNGRTPAVFGADLDFKALSIAPNESQFLETQRFSGEEVCRIMGVPAEMVGFATSGSSVTYANREQRSQDFLTYKLMPMLTTFEEAFDACLPAPHTTRFHTDTLTRADIKTRYETGAIGVRNRLVLPNEWRQEEGRDPIDGGDEFPTTLVPETIFKPIEQTPATDQEVRP